MKPIAYRVSPVFHVSLDIVVYYEGLQDKPGPGARRTGRSQRPAGRAPREAASRSRGGGAPEADPAGTEAGDHEAEETGKQWHDNYMRTYEVVHGHYTLT